MLTVENISLVKEKHILKNVSFELARGEILVLLGPSGAGKTSLLRCLNRLDSLDSGNVFLDGTDTRALPVTELRRRIGLIFQAPALIPGTVKKNVCAGPRLAGRDISDEACRSLLSQVGLKSEYCGRNVEILSLGERQRVALAQVLANEPDILLLDEPTSALDPTATLVVEALIQSLHNKLNTAMVLVTHNLEQAKRFNAHTLVLADGEVLAEGNIRKLMESNANPKLIQFFEGRMESNEPKGP
jgi:putative ABC transport system ATP-binding protein